MKYILVFVGLLTIQSLLGYAGPARAQARDVQAFCTANPNHSGPGEGAEPGDLPGLDLHTWRCENGRVLTCYLAASGRACLRTGPMDSGRMREFVRFCREHPGAETIPASLATGLASHWACRGTRPIMTETIPTDRRGYLRGAWEPWTRRTAQQQATTATATATSAWMMPVQSTGNISGFFDPTYPPTENRQHLGVDLPVPAGTAVRAPANGSIVVNRTSAADIMQAYLILREANGTEHVLGHVRSDLRPGALVTQGQVIGSVGAWSGQPSRAHVHWGVNTRGVLAAVGAGSGGEWGWGRAPVTGSQAQASERGWINPTAPRSVRTTVSPVPLRLSAERLGSARIGMTQQQVSSALGTRLERTSNSSGSCIVMVPASGADGLSFLFERGRLAHFSLTGGSQILTDDGIGIGSREAEVRRAHGSIASEEEPAMHDNPPAVSLIYWIGRDNLGLRFITGEDGLVRKIQAGNLTIRYSEGCR